jgi:hypothetical protein
MLVGDPCLDVNGVVPLDVSGVGSGVVRGEIDNELESSFAPDVRGVMSAPEFCSCCCCATGTVKEACACSGKLDGVCPCGCSDERAAERCADTVDSGIVAARDGFAVEAEADELALDEDIRGDTLLDDEEEPATSGSGCLFCASISKPIAPCSPVCV